ncbi:MAG TPA: hypothetical protein VGF73_10260 [Chthoniobacterales bacterium]|jgi:hypothetical protein
MAEKSGSEESPVKLRQEIVRSRELVVRDVDGLRYELNFPLKIRKAFQRHTVVWVGAALALGLCVALLRARTQRVYVSPLNKKVRSANKSLLESGLLLGLLKLGMTVVQPMIVSHFAKKGARHGDGSASSRRW